MKNTNIGIHEVKSSDWVTENRETFGPPRPPLYALDVNEGEKLTIYPVRVGSLELFGPPFLPIIWAPKWMYAPVDPMDEYNILRFDYSGNFSDIRIATINEMPVDVEIIVAKYREGRLLSYLLLPSDATREETVRLEIFVKGERKILEFEKTRVTNWNPIIAPL